MDWGKRSRSREREKHVPQPDVPLRDFKKVFFVAPPVPHQQDAVNAYRSKHQIKVRSKYGSPPDPLLGYRDLECYPSFLKDCFMKAGFREPTPIQAQAWPIALQGHDLIGIAQTGSGKTLAYMFPGLIHSIDQQDGKYPTMLVLAPTRELALQIYEQFFRNNKDFNFTILNQLPYLSSSFKNTIGVQQITYFLINKSDKNIYINQNRHVIIRFDYVLCQSYIRLIYFEWQKNQSIIVIQDSYLIQYILVVVNPSQQFSQQQMVSFITYEHIKLSKDDIREKC